MANHDDRHTPDREQPEECEGCSFATTALKWYDNTRYQWGVHAGRGPKGKFLCSLCASTMAGNAVEYPEQYHDGQDSAILFAICYVGNTILAALNKAEAVSAVQREPTQPGEP